MEMHNYNFLDRAAYIDKLLQIQFCVFIISTTLQPILALEHFSALKKDHRSLFMMQSH